MVVLIIDDNAALRRLIGKIICDLAVDIRQCSDGSQALAAYDRHRPDWVVIDIEMDEIDGLSATREITAAFPEARIAIVTKYDDDKMREAARTAGAVAFVSKENLLEVRRILAAWAARLSS